MLLMLVSLWFTLLSGVIVACWWHPLESHRKPRQVLMSGYVHASIGCLAVVAATAFAATSNHTVGIIAVAAVAVAPAAGISTVVLTGRWQMRESASSEVAVPSSAVIIHGVLAATAVVAGVRFLTTSL